MNGRSERIRTFDPLVPNQVHYQAVLLPEKNGALGRNRTHNLLIRSQALYPVELLAHINGAQGRSRTGTDFKVRRILSPVRLPISPPGHSLMEVPTGLEPMMTELQSVALPTWPRNHSFVLLRVSYHAAPLLYVNFFY